MATKDTGRGAKAPAPTHESAEDNVKNPGERKYELPRLDSNPPTSENDPEYFVREGSETAQRNHDAEQARKKDER